MFLLDCNTFDGKYLDSMNFLEREKSEDVPAVVVGVSCDEIMDRLTGYFAELVRCQLSVVVTSVNEIDRYLQGKRTPLVVVLGETSTDDQAPDLIVTSTPESGQVKHLAYQRHFVSQELLNEVYRYSPLSLGMLRDRPELIEPLTREVEVALWSETAIRRSDFGCGPVTGLTIEEACQVARYIGESKSLKACHFKMPAEVEGDQWLRCYATTIWYLVEGRGLALEWDEMVYGEMQQLVLTMETGDIYLRRSEKSGKYWIEHESNYYPIHHSEYQQMMHGSLPQRLAVYTLE